MTRKQYYDKMNINRLAKELPKHHFCCVMLDICNSAGFYADKPKDTKAFWKSFAIQCNETGDLKFHDVLFAKCNQLYIDGLLTSVNVGR